MLAGPLAASTAGTLWPWQRGAEALGTLPQEEGEGEDFSSPVTPPGIGLWGDKSQPERGCSCQGFLRQLPAQRPVPGYPGWAGAAAPSGLGSAAPSGGRGWGGRRVGARWGGLLPTSHGQPRLGARQPPLGEGQRSRPGAADGTFGWRAPQLKIKAGSSSQYLSWEWEGPGLFALWEVLGNGETRQGWPPRGRGVPAVPAWPAGHAAGLAVWAGRDKTHGSGCAPQLGRGCCSPVLCTTVAVAPASLP